MGLTVLFLKISSLLVPFNYVHVLCGAEGLYHSCQNDAVEREEVFQFSELPKITYLVNDRSEISFASGGALHSASPVVSLFRFCRMHNKGVFDAN